MTTPPVVSELRMTCDACPVQFEGRLADGRYLYIRSRHGWLAVSAGPSLIDAVNVQWRAEGGSVLLQVAVDEMATPDEVLAVIESAGVLTLPAAVRA